MGKYIRRVQFYETDKMGIAHHSNYIRWMEEARIALLDQIGIPFSLLESKGISSPVVSVNVDYKRPATFDDKIQIDVKFTEYTGVKLKVEYVMSNLFNGTVCAVASSYHCFLFDGRIISLKKSFPDIDDVIEKNIEKE